MNTSTSWAQLIPGLLTAWSGDSAPLPDDESRRLAEQSPEHRSAFLELARRELSGFPFDRVHPRWIARLLPPDPCLQHWAVQVAPAPMRATLARYFPSPTRPEKGRSWMEPTGPPVWFEGWWIAQLRTAIPWPDELPWRRDDRHVLARLTRLEETALAVALERIGSRCVAAAVHSQSPQQLVSSLFAFPEAVRGRLVALVRERAFPSEPWWPQRWDQAMELPVATRLERMALIEIAALARATSRDDDARRLGWHLAPELGELLHAELDSKGEPLTESAEERLARIEGDLADLDTARAPGASS